MSPVLTPTADHVMSAPEAAQAAGITYRQLDYWDRTGWIKPQQVEKMGAGRPVRRYGTRDVVKLAALAHLGRSGVELRSVAGQVGDSELALGSLLVVGPFDLRGAELQVAIVSEADLQATVSIPGRWVVYDPRPLLARLCSMSESAHEGTSRNRGDSDDADAGGSRRSA
jgi:hypothetical protein